MLDRSIALVLTLAFGITATLLGPACSEKSSAPKTAGEDVYSSLGCAVCHGAHAEGGPLAPSLAGAGKRWQRDALIAYLKNPAEYAAKDPRLAEQKKKFTMPMPNYGGQSPEQLGALADFVLSRP